MNKRGDITFDEEELLTEDLPPSVYINKAVYHTLYKLIGTWRHQRLLRNTPDNSSEPPVPLTNQQK